MNSKSASRNYPGAAVANPLTISLPAEPSTTQHMSLESLFRVIQSEYLLRLRFMWLFFLIISSILLPVSTVMAQDDALILDEIVAIVGDDIILKSDVDGYVFGAMTQQKIPYSDELWTNSLEQLINENILVVHAKRDTNLVVSDDQVEQRLDQQIARMSQQLGGERALETAYGRSILEIRAEFADDFRNQILAEMFRNTKLRTIKATPSDIEDWFDQFPTDSLPTLPDIVRVSQVVKKPAVTEEARVEAREILETIRDTVLTGGVTMEEMAILFSDDPGSAESGGLYEGTELSKLVPTFAAVASRSVIGIYSHIFETEFGLHFLRVNERRGDVIDYNHILIAFDPRKFDDSVAIERLTVLRDSILTTDANFAAVARNESEDDFSKVRGGWVVDPNTGERDLFLENLGGLWQTTLLPMKVGDISEPSEVTLRDGSRAFHIVLLQKRVPSHVVDLETDYALIEGRALQDKQARILQAWMEELKEDVYIDYRGSSKGLISSGN